MPGMILVPLLGGFGLGAGLIVAIGAQNAFVLRQGLKHNFPFMTASICSISDAVLITLGVAGLGSVIAQSDLLTQAAGWGGAIFLLFYSLRSFWSALHDEALQTETTALPNRQHTILAALGFSLLNPHVYLDTVVILGSVGASYPADERVLFAIGAMMASVTWFFGLVYGAGRLSVLFQRPLTWRILDIIIGFIMLLIGVSLLREAI